MHPSFLDLMAFEGRAILSSLRKSSYLKKLFVYFLGYIWIQCTLELSVSFHDGQNTGPVLLFRHLPLFEWFPSSPFTDEQSAWFEVRSSTIYGQPFLTGMHKVGLRLMSFWIHGISTSGSLSEWSTQKCFHFYLQRHLCPIVPVSLHWFGLEKRHITAHLHLLVQFDITKCMFHNDANFPWPGQLDNLHLPPNYIWLFVISNIPMHPNPFHELRRSKRNGRTKRTFSFLLCSRRLKIPKGKVRITFGK